jgi:hypothetical protein
MRMAISRMLQVHANNAFLAGMKRQDSARGFFSSQMSVLADLDRHCSGRMAPTPRAFDAKSRPGEEPPKAKGDFDAELYAASP